MKYWFYYFSKFILWVFFRVGFGLKVRGLEHVPKTGGFILASNHFSYLDPPLLGAACPRRVVFMARATLFDHALLGAFMRAVYVIPLERGEGDVAALREAVRRLHAGDVVAIFPEGGRQSSGTMGTAKRGVGLLAAQAGVPVIPVIVKGTFNALPPTSHRLHRAKIQVAFGPVIAYTRPSMFPSGPTATPRDGGRLVARDRHEQLAAAVTRQWHRLAEQLTDG